MQDNALIVPTNYFPISPPGSELKLTCAKDGTDFLSGVGDGQEGPLWRSSSFASLLHPANGKILVSLMEDILSTFRLT